ncbi:unnamed protein product [Porites evermanni]|uniref:Uncharacterized protein n=1 Tax=Porites evermanni TaxID=104178 RepID=A0ABN8Q2N1_9CNID|nr:unnamed protein product [Porites evermanni]
MSITRSFLEPKELLMFFPQNFPSMKVSKNKVLGTAQKLTGTKENIWVDVDIGEPEPWSGLIIKAVPKISSQLPAQHTTSWQRSGARRLEKGPPTYHLEIYCGKAEKLAPLGSSQANEALNNTIGSKAPKTGIIDQVRAMTIM